MVFGYCLVSCVRYNDVMIPDLPILVMRFTLLMTVMLNFYFGASLTYL